VDLAAVTAETFRPHVGTAFRIATPPAHGGVIRLTDVQVLADQPRAPRSQPFSLIFVGPDEPRLDQQIYGLEHDVLGRLELFLVPIGQDPSSGLRYEAVFN